MIDSFKTFLKDVETGNIINHPGPTFAREAPSQPVFDFRKADLGLLEDMVNAAYDDARNAFIDKTLPLPFERCWFLLTDREFMRLRSYEDGNWMALLFKCDPHGKWGCIIATLKGADIEAVGPGMKCMTLPQDQVAMHFYCSIVGLAYLLATPKTHNLLPVDHTASNAMRKTKKQPPLGVHRTVRLDVAWLKEYVPKGSTHASPIPHMRRAHFRTLSNGVKVKVRGSRVLGGGASPTTSVLAEEILPFV